MYTFIETRLFTNLVGSYLSDEEYAELQFQLAADPELGRQPRYRGIERALLRVGAAVALVTVEQHSDRAQLKQVLAHLSWDDPAGQIPV